MQWASYVSEAPDLEAATHQSAGALNDQLAGAEPDLVLVFASPHHAEDYGQVVPELRRHFPHARLVGCCGGGVVGGGREVEHSAALSITAAVLPSVRILPFHLDGEESEGVCDDPASWRERLEIDPGQPAHFLLLADPFTCDARAVAASLDAVYPECAKVGGMASGGNRPGDNALFLDDRTLGEGMVGVVLNGPLRMDTIVAQGCRPVGPPTFITAAVRNRIMEIDGRRPDAVLSELYQSLEQDDRRLFRHSLFVGLAMREGRDSYEHGDFLIRNIVGLDPDAGTLAVGELVRPGQVLQFHVRDAITSASDLDARLRAYKGNGKPAPGAALLFSCLGRGAMLYGEPDHDSRLIAEHLGPLPIGGFFCGGEIGPVERRTFVHGYTSSIALFSPAADDRG